MRNAFIFRLLYKISNPGTIEKRKIKAINMLGAHGAHVAPI